MALTISTHHMILWCISHCATASYHLLLMSFRPYFTTGPVLHTAANIVTVILSLKVVLNPHVCKIIKFNE